MPCYRTEDRAMRPMYHVCMNVPAKFEVRSFIRSWDNRGYFKSLGSPWLRPRSLFSKIFYVLLFGWTLWMYRPN